MFYSKANKDINLKDNSTISTISKSNLNERCIKFNDKFVGINDKKNSTLKCMKIALQENLIDFCYITNLHGFNILRQHDDCKQNSKWMKLIKNLKIIIWSVAILCGMIFGICLFVRVYMRYRITPTITTIETNNYPVSNVPFPAVTICNVNSVYGPHTNELTSILLKHNISTERIQSFYRNLSSLITFNKLSWEFTRTFNVLQSLGHSPRNVMRLMIQPCERMLKECHWLGKPIDCLKIFRLESSESGFCCSFNYKSMKRDLNKGKTFGAKKESGILHSITSLFTNKHKSSSKGEKQSVHVAAAGDQVGLKVSINVETEYYISPRRLFYGAEVIIHDPEDFPQASLVSAYAQPGTEVSVAVTPSIFVTEPDVRNLPVDLRFCIFSDEKQLQITNKYNFQSCIIECRALAILKICNCLPFFYPKVYIFSSLIGVKGLDCRCVPSCTEHIYNVETFISQRFKNVNSTYSLHNTEWITNSLVKVYFKDISCIKYRRELFMKWDDLLSSFGGIFGLCLGGSVLSFLEIIYFATIGLSEKLLKIKYKMKVNLDDNCFDKIDRKKELRALKNKNFINKSRLTHEYLWNIYKN